MVKVSNLLKAQAFFFIGFVYIIIINAVGPALIDVGEALYTTMGGSGTEIQTICWLFIIIIYVILSFVIPLNYIYIALTTPTKQDGPNDFMMSILGVFLVFISIILTVKGWFIIESFASYANDDPVLLTLYWTGLILVWILCNIVAPIFMIIQTQQEA